MDSPLAQGDESSRVQESRVESIKKDKASIPEVKAPAPVSEMPDQAAPNLPVSITLSIDTDASSYLSTPQTNTPEEEFFPREVIASAIGSTNLQAELLRPIKVGTFNSLPAFLLRTRFSFQRATTSSFYRIKAADVTIVFEDAGTSPDVKATSLPRGTHPAVAAWYPNPLFEGEVTTAKVTNNVEGAINATYLGAGADIKIGQTKTSIQSGRTAIHSVRGGGRHLNALTWTIEEDRIAKSGIPRDILFPLIVTHHSKRFRARVTVKAHFGFWKGPLARSVPVLGRNDEPLFFDPSALERMAGEGVERGPDGRLIAEGLGGMDEVNLREWSSLGS